MVRSLAYRTFQLSQASRFDGGTGTRSVLRTADLQVVGDFRNRCLLLSFEGGSSERIRLLGTRADFGELLSWI